MPVRAAIDETLLALIARGRLREAGEQLVRAHARDVVGLCRAMVRDGDAAEDLAQDVFARAARALGEFRGEAASRTWILGIARNRCIDHLRARARDPWADAADADADADAVPDDAPLPHDLLSRRGEVDAALASLAEGDRALVVLRFGHGLDHAELADVFGVREGAVRMRLSRALARMRDGLAAREEPARTLAAAVVPVAAQAAPPAPRGAGVLERLRERLAAPPRRAPAPAAPPPEEAAMDEAALPPELERAAAAPAHPLAAFFAATERAVSDALLSRLLAAAA
jgi:RNA polymerase sigma-70 factor (ECF subfamily)